jgi:hypothetical protein
MIWISEATATVAITHVAGAAKKVIQVVNRPSTDMLFDVISCGRVYYYMV